MVPVDLNFIYRSLYFWPHVLVLAGLILVPNTKSTDSKRNKAELNGNTYMANGNGHIHENGYKPAHLQVDSSTDRIHG